MTNDHWPALIAGVQHFSGKNNLSYVGYDLGCTIALESLEDYSNGKNNASLCFNYDTKEYDINCNLSTNPIGTFAGIGCLGNFKNSTVNISGESELRTPFYTAWIGEHKNILRQGSETSSAHNNHLAGTYTSLFDPLHSVVFYRESTNDGILKVGSLARKFIIRKMVGAATANVPVIGYIISGVISIPDLIDTNFPSEKHKISVQIYEHLADLITGEISNNIGENVSIPRVAILQGSYSDSVCAAPDESGTVQCIGLVANTDGFVTDADQKTLCKNINSNNKQYIELKDVSHFGSFLSKLSFGRAGNGLDKHDTTLLTIEQFLEGISAESDAKRGIKVISTNSDCE